jgi:hypothetical protein
MCTVNNKAHTNSTQNEATDVLSPHGAKIEAEHVRLNN